jgi:hypothetical protein
MSEPGTRPGGLTALAVINFVFGGFGILGGIGTLFAPMAVSMAVEQSEAAESRRAGKIEAGSETMPVTDEEKRHREQQEEMREAARIMKETPYRLFVLAAGVEVSLSALLIVAGVGYLKLRRFLGRTLGTVYAVGAIGWACVQLAYMSKVMGQSFGLLNMIGFIYPAITLFLLRLTFKDDFVNP